ncbi:MAG TPA: c-type cytochrome [Methylotenera sp.]|mgnify:CR=1 FL=1|nr:c-type cytochrome [Methylotenera sp.]
MNQVKLSIVLALLLSALVACDKKDAGTADSAASAATASAGTCELVSSVDNKPLAIKVVDTDTPEAKQFLETCVNPYTKIYAADAEAAKKGKREYNFNNCTGCHGGKLEGIMAPSLSKNTQGGQGAFDQKWVYAKNATDKGMFETIAGGTPGVSGGTMFVWHNQLPGHTGDGLSTDQILKVIAYIRTQYLGDGEKTWLK